MCKTGECEKWAWRLSRYDGRVHAFVTEDRPASFLEAACSHSAPIDKVARGHTGPRCIMCLLVVGDHLAEHHRMGAGC